MIKEFKDETRWLSNFSPCKIILEDVEYPSVEHAYMSAKCKDYGWKMFCANTKSAGVVKKESKDVCLIKNWDKIRLDIMYSCLIQKFNQEPYKQNLINTNDKHIQEGNTWNDKFWGVCLKTNKGENNLGKLIMKIREDIRRAND